MDDTGTILETEHLILRPWREDDAEALYLHAKNPQIGPMAGWEPHTSVEGSLAIIHSILMQPDTFAITLKAGSHPDAPVGSISLKGPKLSQVAEGNEKELGFWLAHKLWGHGLMPEAANEMLRHAFEDENVRRVWATCFSSNERSKRVIQKIGMRYRYTDTMDTPLGHKDKDVFSLSKDRWLDRLYRY